MECYSQADRANTSRLIYESFLGKKVHRTHILGREKYVYIYIYMFVLCTLHASLYCMHICMQVLYIFSKICTTNNMVYANHLGKQKTKTKDKRLGKRRGFRRGSSRFDHVAFVFSFWVVP